MSRPVVNTVTLCGSTRFVNEFNQAQRELSCLGFSCFSISLALDKNKGKDQLPVKELLDLVHFNKIVRSDAVLVVARGMSPDSGVPDDYVGFSTAREIMWAFMQGKSIISMNSYRLADNESAFHWAKIAHQLRVGVSDYSLVEQAMTVLKLAGDAGRPA